MRNLGLGGICAWFATSAVASFALQPALAQQTTRPASAPVAVSPVGEYMHSEMELVAGIRLNADGTFLYGLIVGALDEQAQGRWEALGHRIKLTSVPRPVAPSVTPTRIDAAPGPFAIRVVGPDGHDVPGVDLKIEFDSGAPHESYLPGGPWSLPPEERRIPRFVTFSMVSYRPLSSRLPLDAKAGTVATFTLTPNDFGVIDLSDAHAEIVGETLILYRPEGAMRFKRIAR